jgi:hypothetical protein
LSKKSISTSDFNEGEEVSFRLLEPRLYKKLDAKALIRNHHLTTEAIPAISVHLRLSPRRQRRRHSKRKPKTF